MTDQDSKKAALVAAAHAGRAIHVATQLRASGDDVSDAEIADAMQASGDVFGAAHFRAASPMAYAAPQAPAAATPRNEHHAEYLRLKESDRFAAAAYADAHPEVHGEDK